MHILVIVRLFYVLALLISGTLSPVPQRKRFLLTSVPFAVISLLSFAYLIAEAALRVHPMSAFDTYFTACLGSLDQSTTFFGLKAGSDSLHSYASLQIVWQSLFEFIILVVAVAAIVRVFKLRGLMDEEIAK